MDVEHPYSSNRITKRYVNSLISTPGNSGPADLIVPASTYFVQHHQAI